MSWVTSLLYGFYIVLCLLLLLVILVQKGSEEDLGGAFGGGAGAESLLGAKGDMTLKKITAVLATCFFFLSILIGILEMKHRTQSDILKNKGKNITSPEKDKEKKAPKKS